ncbi:hypothetical protein RJ639_005308 [Escallonia herrerae]|uniref:Uncharacterized protein n=1 Tax=Escallonia herrerae TaxID=1293975 RepID=A0AA88VUC1_9ASTE|nr:hypothetical protein RJ639_005308 [Escallonia herrerae]
MSKEALLSELLQRSTAPSDPRQSAQTNLSRCPTAVLDSSAHPLSKDVINELKTSKSESPSPVTTAVVQQQKFLDCQILYAHDKTAKPSVSLAHQLYEAQKQALLVANLLSIAPYPFPDIWPTRIT